MAEHQLINNLALAELEAAAGQGLTGGGTLLPMSDVIRLARHARHYLAVFDGGQALALYHSKRLAAPGSESCCMARSAGAARRVVTSRATSAWSTTSFPTPNPPAPT
ncbi:hypothetical protein BZL30_5505 [Mycobacterium kansasii]|uniref:DUF222 domain-containing protein n=1 Tax=Mycobacterium kansasii TaxID=1768 RepID=A0A1V3WYA6_MYCKA|nr:hypothetical protein BZL30_5505 [Mycobacterium kansasii]